jgi:ubiquinone/menaquinone biosynthesis C-methylase UbiE
MHECAFMQNHKEFFKDIIQWDIKTWSKALPFWEKNFAIKKDMRALAIGERGGGISLWLALKGVNIKCTDYNDFPEETSQLHKRYKVNEKISYEKDVEVTNLSLYPENSFDIVVFKSVLGALSKKEKQQKAFDEMRRVLKPGGAILFAENSKGSKLHASLRKKFTKWSSYWRYLDYKKDQDLFIGFSSVKLTTNGFSATFGRSEKQRKVLAKFDSVIQPILPPSFNYVIFGVLTK